MILSNTNNVKIQKIGWNNNLFLIKILKKDSIKNYIYNAKIFNLEKLELNIKINYIKYIKNNLYIITEKWLFIRKNNKLEYFSIFTDFIIKDWDYIWIIKDSDKTIKNNFNFWNINWDLIILYNPKKAIKKILYKPNFEIKKILLENNNIIIVSEDGGRFLLNF